MKRNLLRFVGLCLGLMIHSVGFGQIAPQTLEPATNPDKCGSAIIHQQRMQTDPQYAQLHAEMEEYIANYVPTKVNGQYRVPIVVHVVYYTTGLGVGIQNITDDQIREAVRVLNERFRNMGDYNNASGFDIDIEFALAVRDPNGNCTNGITRENAENWSANGYAGWSSTVLSNYQTNGVRALGTTGITDAQIKAVNQWPSNQYFNIWLIPEFDNNGGGNGVQGYASFATAHGTTSDGSVMLGLDFISPTSTTFTHELGHSFNLYHTFEGDDANFDGVSDQCPPNTTCATQGDRVCDTPPHRRSVSDCNSGGTNACTGTSNSLFVFNYMDYSSCGDRFTDGQRTRMQAAITGTRASFLASNGNNKLITPAAPGATAMRSSKAAVCLGESLQLFDVTSCIPNDYLDQVNLWSNFTFAWTITNGTQTINSDRQNPVITPTSAGTYNVTLTITHTTLGTFTSTTNGLFIVVPAAIPACTPTSANAAGNYGHSVSNVTFNTINNVTDPTYTPIYSNWICEQNTVVTENLTYPISVTLNAAGSGSNRLQVMIDWNNDGTFNDAGEGWGDINGDGDMVDAGEGYLLTGTANAGASGFVVSGNILIPTTAVENVVLRMRVIGAYSTLPSTAQKNCTAQFTICDVEDYGVVVKSVSCSPVATTQPSSATICQNGNATFTAAFSNTPTSYVWQVSTNGGGAWTNLTNGAPYSNVTTASMTITGATTGMSTYQYRCVATNGCGSGNSNAATLTVNTPATPTFAAVGPYCSGATIPALPTTSTNSITGTWSPAINNTATTTYTFTPTAGQCGTTTTLTITINPNVTPTFANVGPYCSGATIPALPTTSTNGISGTWSPAINNTATTTYTFTPSAGQCGTTTTKTITITPNVTPTFTAVGPYCSGATIPALPTTSNNSITGTWSPAINNTATTTYTFTPTAGQCATTTTLTITVNPNVTPTFANVGPYCSGASVPAWPTTSTNGITGTWSPAINNTATTTYTFTPTAGQCATTTTKTITINPNVTPTFAAVGPYCSGATIPPLPTTSTNGITGAWSPAINNTATTTYTFTPTAGQCATTTTLTITINPNVTPTFTAVGPYCSGATIPALPTTSNNSITGTWSPAINNTATTTYTFTPTAGQCATTTTLTITVNPNVTPTFANVGPYCSGASVPAWPTTSTNGITGTWSPAINNTATTTYTFTPTAGQCATTTTKTITINPNVTPTFTAVGPYCSGATIPALPTTSNNSITGTWSPAINNTATTTYTFTPTAGQCATTTTLTITINPNVTPTFTAVGPYCSGATIPALPTTSTNSITGTWSPVINNMATTTYTFTPTAGQCATTTTLTITVNPNVTPTFAAVGPYCSGATIPALPTTSTNSITGTWSPAINNTATTTYTFTPTAGQCAATTTLTITINPNVTPAFTAVGPYCSGSTIPALPTTSTNGISGTWSPAINNTATTTYTFTPTAGQCATTTTMTITINPNATATFGTFGPYCSGASVPALPTTSTNGITGTWSPAINNTATTTYTFTPTAGQCSSSTVTTTITINPNVTPAFAAVGPYCSGATIPALPTTSTNGISGTWSPAINNTATTTYTFTPTAGQCATTTTLTITVNPNVAPVFTAAGPYCSGATIPALPTTSNNGISGTWSPAINNTATTTYTFTPTAGQCATTTTLTITVNPNVTPTFTALSAVCQGATAPTLPATSTNGIAGTWSPATFSTSTAGTFTSTFTPSAGQCATTTTLSLTVNATVTPTFAVIPQQCVGSTPPALATTSNNGITGTWSPATINTASAGTTAYTFTPSAGQCSQAVTINVTVGSPATPAFTQIPAFCEGSTAPTLPSTSNDGVAGTWSPAVVSNTASGTYTFTPDAGFCATAASMTISVNPLVTPTFNTVPAFCSGATAPTLPATSNNGITGTWSPAVISNTASGTYVFTPGAGACATQQSLNVTVHANPTVTFGTLDEVCVYDAAVTLTQGAPAGGSYSGTGVTGGQFNPATAGLGTYSLTYAYTDGNGCSGSAQSSIVVDECLGLEDNELSSVNVFPNPSSGNLVIDAGTDQLVSITVYDRLGKLVLSQEVEATSTNIDLSFVADGVYTLRIVTSAGVQHVPVVIKK